jgi:poly(3-hydroxybutyrate) depolymerase
MKSGRALAACLFVCIALPQSRVPGQKPLTPGQEGKLEVPGCSHPCILYVPQDYQRGTRLPLIFFMHGSGGKPTSWPWKSATGGKGYLICGLSYGAFADGGAGGIKTDNKSRLAMVEFIDKVRSQIDKTYGIDQDRVILTGLSMGGWGVNLYGFLEEARDKYRGYCIMAAGLRRGGALDLSVTKGLPLLLINGETDANLPAANEGKPVFEKAGALVTQVVLPGEGHVPSVASMSPPLQKWLDDIDKSDLKNRPLVAIRWKSGQLAGSSEDERRQEHALQLFLSKQDFLKEAEDGKPVLVFCYSTRRGKKDRLTKSARGSLEQEKTCFSFPEACAVPAASRFFTCIKVDISLVDERTDRKLHEGLAPTVILLDRSRTVVRTYNRSRLRDLVLGNEMKKLLTEAEQQAVDARITQTRPVLKEMQGLKRKSRSLNKTIERLNGSSRRSAQRRLKVKLAEQEELDNQYQELCQKLLK